MASRRWFYLIPATGEPRGLVHTIERHNLDRAARDQDAVCRRAQLETGLKTLLAGTRRVAMEYSPNGAIPYVSRVDAGTIELVRAQGVDVVSSGDLVQQFEAHWNDEAIASHTAAAEKLYRVKDRAFEAAAARLRDGVATTEFDLQQLMWQWFAEEGLISDSAPQRLGAGERGQPALPAHAQSSRAIGRDELLLLDLWGKLDDAWRGVCRYHLGGVHRRDRCRTRWRRRLPRSATRATPPSSVVEERPRRARGPRLRAGSRGAGGDRGGRLRRVHPAPHRAQPGRDRARQRRAPGRLRNARRTPAACPAPASRSSRASISINSAYGRKSTWCGARPDPRSPARASRKSSR